jgi:divalent metal cation (Fe/Co/Zn/Cd) transporter
MKFQLNSLQSDIFISIYVVVTLYLRFQFENNSNIDPVLSIVLGISFVSVIWSLIKLKILNPNWFGLTKTSKLKSSKK